MQPDKQGHIQRLQTKHMRNLIQPIDNSWQEKRINAKQYKVTAQMLTAWKTWNADKDPERWFKIKQKTPELPVWFLQEKKQGKIITILLGTVVW